MKQTAEKSKMEASFKNKEKWSMIRQVLRTWQEPSMRVSAAENPCVSWQEK
jgi:hypothetical protein